MTLQNGIGDLTTLRAAWGSIAIWVWTVFTGGLFAAEALGNETAPVVGRVESLVFTAARSAEPIGADFANMTAGEASGASRDPLRRRNSAIIAAGALAVAAYGAANWWNKGFTSEFRTIDEGWFGEDTGDGGADKLGHAFGTYVGTRLAARAFEWVGNDPGGALKLAAWSTFGVFTGVEILDAFTPRWRFSKEDAIMNAAGVGLGVLMENNPRLDRLIDLRLQYLPSGNPGEDFYFDPFGDYSGQTYLVVAKASGIPALQQHKLLRYLEVAVGYGTRGFEVGPGFPGDRSRNLYFGVSLNLSQVLDQTIFRGKYRDSLTHRATKGFLEVVQIPGTAALAKRRL